MRQPRFFSIAAAAATFILMLSSSMSNAAVTIVSINENRVSNFEGVGTGTVTVYGGVAGPVCSAAADATCDSCAGARGLTGPGRLIACNNRRIHPDLQFQITIRSDDTDGYPRITTNSDNSTTEIPQVTSPPLVPKNTEYTITVTWRSICGVMSGTTEGTGKVDTNCVVSSGGASVPFRIGIDSDNNVDIEMAANISIVVRDGAMVTDTGTGASIGKNCGGDQSNDDPSAIGICYFEVGSGDNKAYVKKIDALQGFPNNGGLKFGWVRFLYEPRVTTATVFSSITAASTFEDLSVSGDPGNLTLSPPRVTNAISNSTDGVANIYDFKVAVVDLARNVGYYTDDAHDEDCDNPESTSQTTGRPECHTARPSEVVGILSDSSCFIATASYGSPFKKEVNTFRAFRDRFLVPTAAGKAFIRWYYEYGPKAAALIAKDELLRKATRAALWAPLQFAKIALEYGGLAAIALLCSVLAVPFAFASLLGRKSRGPSRA